MGGWSRGTVTLGKEVFLMLEKARCEDHHGETAVRQEGGEDGE